MFNFLKKKNEELEEALSKNPVLLDVRTEAEFAEGTVSGAINIPVDQLEARLGELSKSSITVVFCRSGMRAGSAKAFLQQRGFTNVVNGGGWESVAEALRG